MKQLIDSITKYLSIGESPTVVSFADDGLPTLNDKLLSDSIPGAKLSNFTFVPISLQYLDKPTVNAIEAEVDDELTRDPYPGNTIVETVLEGKKVVAVIDDLDNLTDPLPAIDACDGLIKKYKGKLSFIFIIEHPSFIEQVRPSIPAESSLVDAVIYSEVGSNWNQQQLHSIFSQQFEVDLPDEVVTEISKLSGNHYGLFKRMYRDKVLGTNHAEKYIENMISSFSLLEINLFKKLVTHTTPNHKERQIKQNYEKVGFVSNELINIPILTERIMSYRIQGKIGVDETGKKMVGLDLDLLGRIDKDILEYLLTEDDEISREQLGDIIWGDKVGEKYSAWAIDQRMSRMRKKLRKLGFDIDVETVYGKGYKLVKH